MQAFFGLQHAKILRFVLSISPNRSSSPSHCTVEKTDRGFFVDVIALLRLQRLVMSSLSIESLQMNTLAQNVAFCTNFFHVAFFPPYSIWPRVASR